MKIERLIEEYLNEDRASLERELKQIRDKEQEQHDMEYDDDRRAATLKALKTRKEAIKKQLENLK